MADKELATKLKKRLASMDLGEEETPESTPRSTPNIPTAPPPPPDHSEPAPFSAAINEQFTDIDELINDTLRLTEFKEAPVWQKQSQVYSNDDAARDSAQKESAKAFTSPTRFQDPLEKNKEDISDPCDIPNPNAKSAPVIPIVHNKSTAPQKPLNDAEKGLERERSELEQKLARQRSKKASNAPDVLEGTKPKSEEEDLIQSMETLGDGLMKGAFVSLSTAPAPKGAPEVNRPTPIVADGTNVLKSPPPPPKKPPCSVTPNTKQPLSPTCSSTSNRSNGSEESDELAAKLARRNMIAEGETVPTMKAPKVSVYTEFHEFTRKQIKYFTETFKRFDEDGDSFIDFEELKRMMEKLGEAQTHIALKGILKLVDEDKDGKVSLREFMLIFRHAATGELSCSEVFNQLAQSVDVTKEGVQGAAGFFQAKINELSKTSKFEEEIREEQEERRQVEEQKKNRKQGFLANKAVFSN